MSISRFLQQARWPTFLLLLLLLSSCGSSNQGAQVKVQAQPKVVTTPTPTPAPVSVPLPAATPTATPAQKPVKLIIPSIDINADIEEVGLDANGNLDTPKVRYLDNVGWYNLGPVPGDSGSAVIDGHLDRPGGSPAVFWNLRNIQVGAKVMVVDAAGSTRTFQVTRVATYPPNQAPVQDIFAGSGGSFLNLITCTGTWIPAEHQTTLRFVAYTTLVPNN
ncbi:class F sortase [Tengunoibacter tsumagoiensis]|uniref:Class F sortase n=1 Tax=Tengunoibacter tsumagoiensis TaxID=2014871 RepID=A0A401ZVU5_9CHLR|nr:class F sortase [Tengunoibacter tsumagoiensis]GCE10967.1 hypothetical protein KTT_08260 [Tengunoibacter tsumagoiensis]